MQLICKIAVANELIGNMEISLNKSEFVRFKGKIAEHLVYQYIKEKIIPSLRTSWPKTIFTNIAWFGDEEKENSFLPEYARIEWKHEEKFFISRCLYPTPELLGKFKLLTKTLENVPDGFLLKLKDTGKSKTLKQGLNDFNLPNEWEDYGKSFIATEYQDEFLSVVDGDIEIIEVKSDSSNLMKHQIKSYAAVLNMGYSLRFFHVEFKDFKANKFELSQRLISTTSELCAFPIARPN